MSNNGFVPYDLIVLLKGIGVSLEVFIISSVIGVILGCLLGLARHYRVTIIGSISTFISEFLKNSPVIVQLFLIYFGLPIFLGIDMDARQAATITLSGNTAAFISVIVVSALASIDKGQIEAARVFGLSEWKILTKIVTPQALLVAIAPLVGLAVNQLQVTSLISVIGVMDITKVGQILNQRTWQPFLVWPVIGITYFILSWVLSKAGLLLENRLKKHQSWVSI
ncbi:MULTISPECIES: amino acid ABC transporter permease [Vibrio]|jgi:polar amino acid transport system permease protein|uniref:Polar amino acid transport system permease protein n=2 Tax=Vibrio TaxID=662 RepID=A0A2J8GXN0_VIBDI|nr:MULTISPECIES: amino acid ABC transporter permease [Vibrio]MCZ4373311.1 amino acid ABC transporter permease [Vibrio diazotrophicus]MDW6019368.1 amino acid ABC transporter permease [Vibrio plantisponsor]NNM39304.1 amino acid ABC transporter permease [Vibrio plantisponsor]PNH90771.1 amino acid ABC transporter permease [Vibrio diazotrophicus]RAS66285.1 polar amino acid transport system permease protein [Vibrio diazotrophicus]